MVFFRPKIKFALLSLLLIVFLLIGLSSQKSIHAGEPTIVITDLYHPYQDDDDNFDLVMGYALPEIDLKAVILDVTEPFRKPVADDPDFYSDSGGPRAAGIIPVMQLNYIFNRQVPFAVGPFNQMNDPGDKMLDIPGFQQQGVHLLLQTLEKSEQPVSILSFGSARILAVALNRNPYLMKNKIKMIHLNAGRAHPEKHRLGNVDDQPREWNVRLDVHGFVRLLRSNLPVSIYPCLGEQSPGQYNTFWELKSLDFIGQMEPELRRYMDYLYRKRKRLDFLRFMDVGELAGVKQIRRYYPEKSHLWTTESWLQVAGRILVKKNGSEFHIVSKKQLQRNDTVISGKLIPVSLSVKDDGTFVFSETSGKTNFKIYKRVDPVLNQKAFNVALPNLYKSFKTGDS